FMRAWKNSNAMTEKVERIINLFDLISEHAPTDYELFQAGEETLINTIDVAHILGQPISSEALVDRYMALPIKKSSELAIDGRFLIEQGMRPGAKLGETLNNIRKLVVSSEIENTQEAIEVYLDELK
ncbi:MAG: CCA tRNA nucleotidyltransferase, partial [Lactobacillus sp.]|nr:CCA tRNA nucleotidyltransferase [Lactobacillus sp.]